MDLLHRFARMVGATVATLLVATVVVGLTGTATTSPAAASYVYDGATSSRVDSAYDDGAGALRLHESSEDRSTGGEPPDRLASGSPRSQASRIATEAGSGAESAVAGRVLGRQLASEQQVGEAGTAMAGAGTSTELRAASRLADQYGGSASDWAKIGGSSYRGADGLQFETHWYENIRTGQRVEFKTKITGGAP